jgi:hypothetical protein
MSDAREDIRNLFHAQGLSGGYREFGQRPAAPRPAVPPQMPQAGEAEPKDRRLDLVRRAPDPGHAPVDDPAPSSSLKALFDRLADLGAGRPNAAFSHRGRATDPMHLPLAELFQLLESRGGRR